MSRLNRGARLLSGMAVSVALGLSSLSVYADDPIRIGFIDPLSGPFANVGDAGAKHFQFVAERINADGGILGRDVEIVPMDNRQSASESAQLAQRALSNGITFLAQGNGSDVGAAILETVERNNRRNPNNQALYLNYAAIDPALTNERCSYWHFRFDANNDIKLEALTNYMLEQGNVERVFLINMDYSHGHAVSATAKRMIAEKMPDVEVVGDVFHPIGQVRDFSPYVSRIRQSNADVVITGNWGNDLSLLVREAESSGLDVGFYTYYGGGLGTPAALAERGEGRLFQITEWHADVNVDEGHDEYRAWYEAYGERHPDLDWYFHRIHTLMYMLKAAIEDAGTTEAAAVASALEEMRFDTPMGEVYMRGDDHQLFQPMYLSVMDTNAVYDVDNTGVGFSTIARIEMEDTMLPTSCEMQRP